MTTPTDAPTVAPKPDESLVWITLDTVPIPLTLKEATVVIPVILRSFKVPIPAAILIPALSIVTPDPTTALVPVMTPTLKLLEVITPVTFRCWVVVTPITPS